MIFVYPIKDEDHLAYYRNHKDISQNPEDYRLCVARERWQELEYLIPRGQVIFWNQDTNKFTETDFTPIIRDISNHTFFPRTSIPQYRPMVDAIMKKGWDVISHPYEYYAIERWMYYIPHTYLGRKITTGTKENVGHNFDSYYNQVKDEQGRFFIKTVKKDWSYDGSRSGWFETGMALSLEAGGRDDQVMLSEWVELAEDEHNTMEYRCFIIKGKVESISRYMDYEVIPPPKEAVDYANKLCKELVGKYLPSNVVIDIAQLKDGRYIILECNDVCSSGRYVGNTVESLQGWIEQY